MLITLNVWGFTAPACPGVDGSLDNIHIAFTLGTALKAVVSVITLPVTVQAISSTSPLGKITEHFLLIPAKPAKSWSLSTVIAVVVADFILPDLLDTLLTGSFIWITLPGLTIAPASIEVVKVTVSDSCCSLNKIAFASLFAWPLDVQANAFTLLTTVPNFAIATLSSTTS